MTAKEIILQYDKEYSANNELLNAVREFVEEKCKEQREICADEYSDTFIDFDAGQDKEYQIIINAPQPKIFEEGGK